MKENKWVKWQYGILTVLGIILLSSAVSAAEENDKTKEATQAWDKIIAANPSDRGKKLEYASFLINSGQGEKAVEIGREIAAKNPQDISMRYWIGDAYLRQEKPAEAANELRAMLKDFPQEEKEIQRRLAMIAPAETPQEEKPAKTPASFTDKPIKKKGPGWFFKD